MTPKKLSPERLAEIQRDERSTIGPMKPEWIRGTHVRELLNQRIELLGHIEALEAELKDWESEYWVQHTDYGWCRFELSRREEELAESRAECERLRCKSSS